MGLFKYMLRKGSGSPGATTRLLTENYFKFIFKNENSPDTAMCLLLFRNSAYKLQGIEIQMDRLHLLSENCYDDIPLLIFCLCLYENTFKPNQLTQFIKDRRLISQVIVEEYNKLSPNGQKYKDSEIDETFLLFGMKIVLENLT